MRWRHDLRTHVRRGVMLRGLGRSASRAALFGGLVALVLPCSFTESHARQPGAYADSAPFVLNTNRIGFAESQVVTSATPLARPTELGDPRPNPFNPTVTIPFTVARSTSCRLRIYDTAGRLVTTLRDGLVGAGEHRVTWDGRDTSQRPVASGVYFVEFVTPQARQIRKIALTK